MKNQDKNGRKTDSIKYKPILELIPDREIRMCKSREVGIGFSINYPNDNQYKADRFLEVMEKEKIKKRLIFQNVGRGETSSSYLEVLEVKDISWDKESHLSPKVSYEQFIGEIVTGGYFLIIVELPPYIFLREDLVDDNSMTTIIKIKYNDMFNEMRYRLDLHIKINVIFEKFIDDYAVNYKDNFKLAQVSYEIIQIMPEKYIYSKK